MKLKSVQYLRAVAVLFVAYSHSIDLQENFSPSFQQKFFYLNNFGAIGADIFFVLSGFIICFISNKYFGLRQGVIFLNKRIIRIYPIYYIITFFQFIILKWKFPSAFQYWDSINRLKDSLILIPLLNNQIIFPVITTAWTLIFEWCFYILFFLLIILGVKEKPFTLITLLTAGILLGIIAPLPDYRLKLITNPIMLEFIFGIIIYIIYEKFTPSYWVCLCLFYFSVGGFFINIFTIDNSSISEASAVLLNQSGLKRSLLWGVPSATFVASTLFLEKTGKIETILNNKLILLIGDASYSIYLISIPCIYLFLIMYEHVSIFLPPDLSIIFHLIALIIVGVLFYTVIEKPLLRWSGLKN